MEMTTTGEQPVHPRSDRGAALVEFALVLPLLTMFLFAIVQFGMAYDMKQAIAAAAREAARMAAIPAEPTASDPGVTYATIRDRVDDAFQGVGADGVDHVTVTVVDDGSPLPVRTCTDAGCTPATSPPSSSPCTGQDGRTVVVTATKAHDLTIPFVGVRSVTLTGRGEFRCEA